MKIGRAFWICYAAAAWFLVRAFGNAPSVMGTGTASVSTLDLLLATEFYCVGLALHKASKKQPS